MTNQNMAEDNITLEKLERRLNELQETCNAIYEKVVSIERQEDAELGYISLIKSMESKELENLDNLTILENKELSKLDTVGPKKFTTVLSWKENIWDNCPNKKMTESSKAAYFTCEITKKLCSFDSCPLNLVK